MKPGAALNKIRAEADLKYRLLFQQKVDMLTQMGMDAAVIAAHEVLRLGPGRAKAFRTAYEAAMNEMAVMMYDDQKDDTEFVYAKEKIDQKIKAIVGAENFSPWEERYGAPKG